MKNLAGVRTKMLGGYAGKILYVDLTKKEFDAKLIDAEMGRIWLGARGFCSKILYDLMKPGIEPFSPENTLIFATGPFTGTLMASCKYTIAAKSPMTGGLGYAVTGDRFGAELKFAGYDLIVFQGAAKKPVYLWINNQTVEIRDASYLWGKDTFETVKIIREELKDNSIKVASIGQAGENLVRYASVISDRCRAAARAGTGAVMGSKKLKAVAVRGTGCIKISDSEKFEKLAREANYKINENPIAKRLREFGTWGIISLKARIGDLPTKNHWSGIFPYADQLFGTVLVEKYLVKRQACIGCPIGCSRYIAIKDGKYAGVQGRGAEYEAIDALGPSCWNSDFSVIAKGYLLCNKYGMDAISTGMTIGFAMECFEKRVVTKEDTDGIDITWGNGDTIIKLIEKIAKRDGFGDILAEGSKRAAQKIGRGAEKYAMHVKGLEIPCQEPRTLKAFALGHSVSNRGADHLYGLPCIGFNNDYESAKRLWGEEIAKGVIDIYSPMYKGYEVKVSEDWSAISDALGICKFVTVEPQILWPEDLALAYVALTGIGMSQREMWEAGERIVNIERAFNVREGFTRKDDYLPRRFLLEGLPEGPTKGQIVELDMMLDEYYRVRGWNKGTGIPTKTKLKQIGLVKVAHDLESLGIPRTEENEY